MIQPAAPLVGQSDLINALKTLAECSSKHATATLQQATATADQAKSMLLHHKVPTMELPTFKPNDSKNDPMAWTNFWNKFQNFSRDCVDDKSRLGFLVSAVSGDALNLIQNLEVVNENFEVAKGILEKHYHRSDATREKLLLACIKYKVPNPNFDYSNFLSSIISLNVFISELKRSHNIDIMSEVSGQQIMRALIHDMLPGDILDKYQSLTGTEYPSLVQFIDKARDVCDRLIAKKKNRDKDRMKDGNSGKHNHKNHNTKHHHTKVQEDDTSTMPTNISNINKNGGTSRRKKKSCMFCGQLNHKPTWCPTYVTVQTRADRIKSLKGSDPCIKCLLVHRPGDSCVKCVNKECTSQDTHGIMACPSILAKLAKQTSGDDNSKAIKVTTSKRSCSVALPTLTAQIESSVKDKSLQVVGVLMDTAAQQSLIHREVVTRLGIVPIRQEFTTLVGFGMSRPVSKLYDVVRIRLFKNGYQQKSTVNCLVVDRPPAICNMTGLCQLAKKLAKKGADIGDSRLLNQKQDVLTSDILIGADYFMTISCPQKPPTRLMGNYLLHTIFGQCLIGKISGSTRFTDDKSVSQLSIVHVATQNGMIDNSHLPGLLSTDENLETFNGNEIVTEFSSFSDIGIDLYDREKLDLDAWNHFKNTVKYHETKKQFECGIPWVDGRPPQDLPHNKHVVLNMFKATMKKLDKEPSKRDQYKEVHMNEITNNFIELVPEDELEDPKLNCHYLHHFPVYKKDPLSTTPCRRVFNASFRTKGNVALNDCMLKGPSLTPNILKVQMRMRLKKYLMCADVSKAFLRVLLRYADRNFTRFYARKHWEDPNSQILVYRFKVVLFGSTASPFLLNATILHLFECNNMFDFLLDCYVDNLFFELDTVEELMEAMNKATRLFDSASMPLREWASNSAVMNGKFKELGIFTKADKKMKTLGYTWDFEKDILTLAEVEFEVNEVCKRSMFSDYCSVYDPIGLITPVSICAKVVAQSCWSLGMQWDTIVPDDTKADWIPAVHNLRDALKLEHSRFIGMPLDDKISLHVFADAGKKSLGAVAYLVGSNATCMFASKGKVCPLKFESFTIPRKELVAISVATRLAQFIILAVEGLLSFSSVVLWSDSSNALTWTLSGVPHEQIFIRNRVKEINAKRERFQMKLCYILTDNNPADFLTKYIPDAITSDLWLKGPKVLKDQACWNQYSPPKGKVDEIPVYVGNINKAYSLQVGKVSEMQTWNELLIATATALLLNTNEELRAKHLAQAELLWFKELQSVHFSEELCFLQQIQNHATKDSHTKRVMREKKISAPSLCLNLNLFLDSQGLIRLFTSLANCKHLGYDTKFPILLPRDDYVTKLLIKNHHVAGGHTGPQQLLNSVRTKFWIPKLGQILQQVIKSCANCKIHFSMKYHVPSSPPLPEFRVSDAEPFTLCGVDMTGHFYVKVGTETVKRFVILFACCSSRAIHVEIAEDASAEAFARCFIRFTARRGSSSLLISDNGSNLVHFSKDLLSISEDAFTKDLLIKERVEWKFIPVRAAFMGGMYERLIGLFKTVIKRSIGRNLLTLDEFSTVCAYAEASCNDRPLYYVSRQDTGTVPLTPNMLIFGRNLRQCSVDVSMVDLSDPSYAFGQPGHLNRTCKRLKSTLIHVRKIWANEYLVALREHDQLRNRGSPSTKYMLVPNINDVVVFDSGSVLKVGKIVELIPSSDQEIRKVKVESEGHESVQAVANLRRLESGGSSAEVPDTRLAHQADTDSDSEGTASAVPRIMSRNIPRREAAVKAQEKWLGQFLVTLMYLYMTLCILMCF